MAVYQSANQAVYVGIDYHQDSIQVCVLDGNGQVLANTPVANDWQAVSGLACRFGRVKRAALEACGGAADLADHLVERAGWSVDLAHAGYVARLKGSPDKSDFSDAQLLADLTRVGYLPRVWLAPQWVRELRRLVRYRQQQVDARRHEKLRIGALLREHRVKATAEHGRPWSTRWLAWLESYGLARLPEASRWIIEQHLLTIDRLSVQVKRIEHRLAKHTADDAGVQRLLDERGVGPVTAWVLRAEIGRFDRFTSGKQLARFCGLSPRNASSGARQADAGLIKAGNNLLRATLIELAHRLARWDDRWRASKQHLRGQGKAGSVIAAAIANRWVRGLYYRMIEPTDPCVGTNRQAENNRGALEATLG